MKDHLVAIYEEKNPKQLAIWVINLHHINLVMQMSSLHLSSQDCCCFMAGDCVPSRTDHEENGCIHFHIHTHLADP